MERIRIPAQELARQIIDVPRPRGLQFIDTPHAEVVVGIFEAERYPSGSDHTIVVLTRVKATRKPELTVAEISSNGALYGHRTDIIDEAVFTSGTDPSELLMRASTEDYLMKLSYAKADRDPSQSKRACGRFIKILMAQGEVFPEAVRVAGDKLESL